MALFTELKSNNDDFENNIELLHRFITEDQKLVTFKWLSSELGIFYNQAQGILSQYVRRHSTDNICVIYRVESTTSVNGVQRHKIQLVDSSRVQDITPITSIYVYCISADPIKDLNQVYLVDYQMKQNPRNANNRYQNVRCVEAKIKESPTPASVDSAAPTVEVKQEPQSSASNKAEVKRKEEAEKPKAGAAASIKSEPTAAVKKESNIMSMLKSAPPAKKSAAAKKKSAALASRAKKRPSVKIFTSDEESEEEVGRDGAGAEGAEDSQSNKRRCMVLSDSEEEERLSAPPRDVDAPMDEIDPNVPDTGVMNFEESGELSPAGADGVNLIKRMVSKTTTDENGYMVTEKVWEWVEDDNPVEVKPVVPVAKKVTPKSEPLTKKQKKASSDAKQLSMMSFFKKK